MVYIYISRLPCLPIRDSPCRNVASFKISCTVVAKTTNGDQWINWWLERVGKRERACNYRVKYVSSLYSRKEPQNFGSLAGARDRDRERERENEKYRMSQYHSSNQSNLSYLLCVYYGQEKKKKHLKENFMLDMWIKLNFMLLFKELLSIRPMLLYTEIKIKIPSCVHLTSDINLLPINDYLRSLISCFLIFNNNNFCCFFSSPSCHLFLMLIFTKIVHHNRTFQSNNSLRIMNWN
jgi:hypothetical protein